MNSKFRQFVANVCAVLSIHVHAWREKSLTFNHPATSALLEYGRVLKEYRVPAPGSYHHRLTSGFLLLTLSSPLDTASNASADDSMLVDEGGLETETAAPPPEVVKSKSKKKKDAAKKQREEEENGKELETDKSKPLVRFSIFSFASSAHAMFVIPPSG